MVRKPPFALTRTTQRTGRDCGAARTLHHDPVALQPATRGPLTLSVSASVRAQFGSFSAYFSEKSASRTTFLPSVPADCETHRQLVNRPRFILLKPNIHPHSSGIFAEA